MPDEIPFRFRLKTYKYMFESFKKERGLTHWEARRCVESALQMWAWGDIYELANGFADDLLEEKKDV